jgi:hypothetical protein
MLVISLTFGELTFGGSETKASGHKNRVLAIHCFGTTLCGRSDGQERDFKTL